MKFYNRKHEISLLQEEKKLSKKHARLTVLSGRRRVGKTQLIQRAFQQEPFLYFLVTRKSEVDQTTDFINRAKKVLPLSIYGTGMRFGDLFKVLMEESLKTPFTLAIDEFQEFKNVNPGIFGGIQEWWDTYHADSKINLIVSGSVNTMMHKLFFDEGEPLYGRATARFQLAPFSLSVLKEILADHNPDYTAEDLLALWTFTGGVARYVEELMDRGYSTKDKMIDGIMREGSFFLDEGKSVLIQEMGKEYGVYFSVLSAIARGITTRNEIEQAVGVSVGGYLTKLETVYSLIEKRQPIFETNTNKSCHYRIRDNFFRFWFRFIYANQDYLELKRFDILSDLLRRDYETFSGLALEQWFRERFAEDRAYTAIGSWWDRRGENEIDLVCEDKLKGRLDFYEIKRNAERIDLNVLKSKSEAFFTKNPDKRNLVPSFRALSLGNVMR